MPIRKLKEFLDGQQIHYTSIMHAESYTAQRTAQCAHVPGRDMAKTVIVRIDGQVCMVVVPAPCHVNLDKLRELTSAESVALATENEFHIMFPDCETGAMPPFGNLYGMDVYVQRDLADEEEIAFNAGTHTEVIQVGYDDFERMTHPHMGDFTR
ncbi:MAG: YbaK/EbsC family protein [bacterium]|nr:YbaK/EbsC family protein [bacterium]